jgi:hypothetical protein
MHACLESRELADMLSYLERQGIVRIDVMIV